MRNYVARILEHRDKDTTEVDLVMMQGKPVWGAEVKASAAIANSDGKGLRRLAQQCGYQSHDSNPRQSQSLYKICHALDAYFAKRLTMKLASAEDAVKVRNAAYARPKLLEDFANENPAKLSAEDLTTVRSWQHQVSGRFLFQAERKEGCWFQSAEGNKVYLVQGLIDRISDLVPFLPVYVETRLLPFRDKIVIDGLMMPYHMHFSSRMAKGFQEDIKALIAKRGLITSLPEGNTATAEPDDAAMLKFYLSTASTRRQYIREAIALSVKKT